MPQITNGIPEVLCVTGLGSDPATDSIVRGLERLARGTDGALQIYAPQLNDVYPTEDAPGAPRFVVVSPVEEQGARIESSLLSRRQESGPAYIIAHSLGLLALSHVDTDLLKGSRLTAIAPAFTSADKRIRDSRLPREGKDLTEKQRTALVYYENMCGGQALWPISFTGDVPVIIPKAFMRSIAFSPFNNILPFLETVAEHDPDNPPRLIFLQGDSRLGDQEHEIKTIRSVLPEDALTIAHYHGYGERANHYLTEHKHVKVVLRHIILGEPLNVHRITDTPAVAPASV